MDWEVIERRGYRSPSIERAKVPGGWLVRSVLAEEEQRFNTVVTYSGTGLTFVPDEAHQWKVEKVK